MTTTMQSLAKSTSPADVLAAAEVTRTLAAIGDAVLSIDEVANNPGVNRSWTKACSLVQEFHPVPCFIWKLSKYAIGNNEKINRVLEPSVIGLKRLLCAAASDKVLGTGEPVEDLKKAAQTLPSDVIAAVAVLHGVCRRLQTREHERFWRPVLEDAILRAHLGFFVGQVNEEFGPGRGMLAGFSSRAGLAILLATGDLDQAQRHLEATASGTDLREAGLEVYGIDPLHVGALMLSATGCGRDAAYGTVCFVAKEPLEATSNQYQQRWLGAFSIVDAVREGRQDELDPRHWENLGFASEQDRKDLAQLAKMTIRRGHGWPWIINKVE
jgi:hypothetical protein